MSTRVSEKVVARAKAVKILKKISVFDGLLEDEYFKVLAMCSSVSAKEGAVLFNEGDDGTSMFILLAGEINIDIDGVGTIHTMHGGEILGEISLVKQVPRTASANVSTNCVMLQLYAEIFHEIVKKHPRIGYTIMRNVARILADRLVQSNEDKK